MNIVETIISTYPALTSKDFWSNGCIEVRDDSDGQGAYLAKWEYSQPIPEGLTLGKPVA